MTEEEKLQLIQVKLKRYKDQYMSLETCREDLNRYRNELFEKIVDLSEYDVKRKKIGDAIINTSLVSMVGSTSLGIFCEKFHVSNEMLNTIISNPTVYCGLTLALAVPLFFGHQIANNIVIRKYGNIIAKIDEKNNENIEEIDLVNQNLNFVYDDLKNVTKEIRMLEDTINVLNKVEDDDFINISQPKIKQLIK